jgi:hypothetical protein
MPAGHRECCPMGKWHSLSIWTTPLPASRQGISAAAPNARPRSEGYGSLPSLPGRRGNETGSIAIPILGPAVPIFRTERALNFDLIRSGCTSTVFVEAPRSYALWGIGQRPELKRGSPSTLLSENALTMSMHQRDWRENFPL